MAVKSHESRMTFGIPRPDNLLQISIGWHCEDWCSNQIKDPAILALKQAVRELMPTVEFVMEESPVEEHQSNGTIEVTVREMQKQARVMKSALEERMKCETD